MRYKHAEGTREDPHIVRVVIRESPTFDYPFAVTVDGGQEVHCRSKRDCQILLNGVLHGLLSAGHHYREEWDPRIEER